MNIKLLPVGIIKLNRETIISDPCYSYGTWCTHEEKHTLPGIYNCYTRTMDGFISRLIVVHKDYEHLLDLGNKDPNAVFDNFKSLMRVSGNVIGVDSGIAGVYDSKYFKKNQPDNDYSYLNSWLHRVADVCHADGGVLDNRCCVSYTGYGDGGYDLYMFRNKEEKTVAFIIDYLIEDRFNTAQTA